MSSDSPAYAVCLSARRTAGLSQRALAAASGVSPSTIARIEKGRMEPTLALLTRLVDACGLELRLSLAVPASRPEDDRRRAGALSVEERLLENDRLAALHMIGQRHHDLCALGRPKDLRAVVELEELRRHRKS